jgi:putative molybdopterin biosynthesis protein
LLTVLRSETWQHLLGTLPGYDTAASGEVQSLRALLPWWTFPREKKHSH